jgi:DNA-binding response OmpR family regulator
MAKNGQKALSAGADAFFAKPVDPDELLHFIGAN